MSLDVNIQKPIDHLRKELNSLQIGRASVALVEDIQVDSYGSHMALKTTANISCPDSKTIRIEPWDKSLVGGIEKSLQESNIGINPQNMGDCILLPIPPMTEDRRKDLVKVVHKMGEHAKISIRSIRHDEMKNIKKLKDEKEISEDQAKDEEARVQEKIDTANKEIDTITKTKESDVLTI